VQILARPWRPRWDTPVLRHAAPTKAHAASGEPCGSQMQEIQGSAAGGGAAAAGTLEEVFRQAAAALPLVTAKAAAIAESGGGERWSPAAVAVVDPRSPQLLAGEGVWGGAWWSGGGIGGASGGSAQSAEGGGCAQSSLKPWGRAVEKVVRCYGGDSARLVDCCRYVCMCERLQCARATAGTCVRVDCCGYVCLRLGVFYRERLLSVTGCLTDRLDQVS
jgi:hypothetical protein